jgi:hypothetical protein
MKYFIDIYGLPFKNMYGHVYDSTGNFIFQFLTDNSIIQHKMLDVINWNSNLTNPNLSFHHEKGYIIDNDNVKVLLIRGWGNLTGVLKLSEQDACNVQDSLA